MSNQDWQSSMEGLALKALDNGGRMDAVNLKRAAAGIGMAPQHYNQLGPFVQTMVRKHQLERSGETVPGTHKRPVAVWRRRPDGTPTGTVPTPAAEPPRLTA